MGLGFGLAAVVAIYGLTVPVALAILHHPLWLLLFGTYWVVAAVIAEWQSKRKARLKQACVPVELSADEPRDELDVE